MGSRDVLWDVLLVGVLLDIPIAGRNSMFGHSFVYSLISTYTDTFQGLLL